MHSTPDPSYPKAIDEVRKAPGAAGTRAFWALMAPVVLFGGLFSGIFTPTEAAAVAVTYALELAAARSERRLRERAAARDRHWR